MMQHLFTHTPLLYAIQSLWRDEAFSVLASQESLFFILTKLGFEPPVYYTLLHFWMKLFGESELAARSLSVLGFVGATVIIIEWAWILYRRHWLSWYLPLTFFFNPMLLYYAFEVRTYGVYMFFATAALFAYATHKWRLFTVTAILGFYTHVYMLPYIGMLCIHSWFTRGNGNKWTMKRIFGPEGFRPFLIFGAAVLPWLIKIAAEMSRLKSSWYFPVNMQLVRSVLGNMFTGYEGTPWFGWQYTAYLSAALVAVFAYMLYSPKTRKHGVLLVSFGIVPLAVIVAISFIKPLFVNRYLIPTTITLVLAVSSALSAIRNPIIQRLSAGVILAGLLWFNWWYAPYHTKPAFRETFRQINTVRRDTDVYLADHPLNYLETLYYAQDRSKVFLYNPGNGVFPWYVGDALISPERMTGTFPVYPQRGFLIHQDTTYDIVYRLGI